MCGIAGVVGGDPAEGVRAVDAMLDLLAPRGPDGRGQARGGVAHLGCTRLAIRGGARGAQPLRTRRGLLVFNGEIYNLPELVKDLAWHGVVVPGDSDTQAVGALLDVYGVRAVDRLNGMFALAWDDGTTVWLARDPAGVKPLYYDASGGRFASEISPLLGDHREVSPRALARWATFHCAYGDETFFAGIHRVPAGGIVALPEARIVRGGDPALRFGAPNPALDAERLRRVLGRAVGDAVPEGRFGIAFSGGLDSGLVASLTPARGRATAYHGRVGEEGCDESPHARAAARELGMDLVEVPVTAERCLEALPRVVRALEEPVAGPGSVAQWLVAERAARDVRVVLSGCGGDELFGGYARAVALVRDTPPQGLEAYAPLFARLAGLAPARRAFAALDRRGDSLLSPAFLEAHPAPEEEFAEAFAFGGLDPAAAAARAEMAITLPALLQVEDRMSMAWSVEARVPLLDRRLLRVAGRLAPEARVDPSGRAKALLRDAGGPVLPPAIRARRDKMGFPLPLRDWFAGPWRDFARDVLLDRATRERGWVDAARVDAALDGAGRYDRGLVAALWIELWCRAFLDGKPGPLHRPAVSPTT